MNVIQIARQFVSVNEVNVLVNNILKNKFFFNSDDHFVYSSITISPNGLVFHLGQCWKALIHAPVKWSAHCVLPPLNIWKKASVSQLQGFDAWLQHPLQCSHLT